MIVVGLVSDTHGRFDPALPRVLGGARLIVHAGDVVGPGILEQLRALAPVEAVRGNCDVGALGEGLPEQRVVRLGELKAFVAHDLGKPEGPSAAMARAIGAAGARVVIHGHSHQPAAREIGGVVYVNPGSAGPRRFSLPRCAGLMVVDGRRVRVEILDLDDPDLGRLFPALETTL